MKLLALIQQAEALLPELKTELAVSTASLQAEAERLVRMKEHLEADRKHCNDVAEKQNAFAVDLDERERLVEAREKSLQGIRQQLAESRAQVKARDEDNLAMSKKLEEARSKLGKATERLTKIDALFPQLKEATRTDGKTDGEKHTDGPKEQHRSELTREAEANGQPR